MTNKKSPSSLQTRRLTQRRRSSLQTRRLPQRRRSSLLTTRWWILISRKFTMNRSNTSSKILRIKSEFILGKAFITFNSNYFWEQAWVPYILSWRLISKSKKRKSLLRQRSKPQPSKPKAMRPKQPSKVWEISTPEVGFTYSYGLNVKRYRPIYHWLYQISNASEFELSIWNSLRTF